MKKISVVNLKKEMKEEYTGNLVLSKEELKRLVSAARSSKDVKGLIKYMLKTDFAEIK